MPTDIRRSSYQILLETDETAVSGWCGEEMTTAQREGERSPERCRHLQGRVVRRPSIDRQSCRQKSNRAGLAIFDFGAVEIADRSFAGPPPSRAPASDHKTIFPRCVRTRRAAPAARSHEFWW